MPLPKKHKDVPEKPLGSKKKLGTKRHEEELAKDVGGFRRPASGAIAGMKGDVSVDSFLMDLKETNGASILITRNMLLKIKREAIAELKEPVLVLQYNSIARGTPSRWACIPLDVLISLLKGK